MQTEKVSQKLEAFVKAHERCKEKLKSLQSQVQQSVADLKAAHEEANPDSRDAQQTALTATELTGLLVSHQHKLRQENILQMAELSALAAEVIMRTSEAFSESAPTASVAALSVTEKATFINEISDYFTEEISGLSAASIDSIRQIITQLKAVPSAPKATVQAAEKDSTSIYMDSGSAIAHVSEAKKFTVQLCKYAVVEHLSR